MKKFVSQYPNTFILLVAVVAAMLGFMLSRGQTSSASKAPFQSILIYPKAKTIEPFALHFAGEGQYTKTNWIGHWTLLYFGFTHCPDACPTALSALKQALEKMPPAHRPQVHFISIDPQRDDSPALHDYVTYYDANFVAATGTVAELEHMTRQLGVLFEKVPNVDNANDYTMDHTANVLIINPAGNLYGLIRPPFTPTVLRDDLSKLMELKP
jgi:protein SCO1